MIGPVAMHAMRGISAFDSFHTCRPASARTAAPSTRRQFRYQPPYPSLRRHRIVGKSRRTMARARWRRWAMAIPQTCWRYRGRPRRLDRAYSWEHPLAALPHAIGDPQRLGRRSRRIDTLLMFMANMGWNSSMNTSETRRMLCDRDEASGGYRIPHIIYSDAYLSETVAFADLVLPDTTYLERHDCISMLDRPISDADCAADAIRQPVVEPDRDVRPFRMYDRPWHAHRAAGQSTMTAVQIPTASPSTWSNTSARPVSTSGRLARRNEIGRPDPDQIKRYVEHGCVWEARVPDAARYYKMANRDYLDWAKSLGFLGSTDAIVLQLYCETLQHFRLAAQGHGPHQPPTSERERVERYFDPLPFWYASVSLPGPVDDALDKTVQARAGSAQDADYPLHAITQRPMFMYHSWGSRCLAAPVDATTCLHHKPHRRIGRRRDWIWLASPRANPRAGEMARRPPGTLDRNTRSASTGAWKLDRCTRKSRRLPAQPSDRCAATQARFASLRECGPGHRPGGVVRPARAHRARSIAG
jgi:hypothetical protein